MGLVPDGLAMTPDCHDLARRDAALCDERQRCIAKTLADLAIERTKVLDGLVDMRRRGSLQAELESLGVSVDAVPGEFTFEALLEVLKNRL